MSEVAANPALRIFVIVLAVIGATALLAVVGMALMHGSMMGGTLMGASMMGGRGC